MAGITKIFKPDIVAISDLYLSIPRGDFVYLIGETGSGKEHFAQASDQRGSPEQRTVIGGWNEPEKDKTGTACSLQKGYRGGFSGF